MRQNRLAKMLEMDESTLSRIVNGFRDPSGDQRQNIAALLQCDLVWLFEKEEIARHGPPEGGIAARKTTALRQPEPDRGKTGELNSDELRSDELRCDEQIVGEKHRPA